MNGKKILVALLLALLTACENGQGGTGGGVASAGGDISVLDLLAEEHSVLDVLTEGTGDAVLRGWFADSRSPWEASTEGEPDLMMDSAEMSAGLMRLLNRIPVQKDSGAAMDNRPDLSAYPEYLSFCVVLGKDGQERQEQVVILPEGMVYVSRSGENTVSRWQSREADLYGELMGELEELRERYAG